MRTAIVRALLFAGCALAATLAIDLVLSVLYQGGATAGGPRQSVAFRAAVHGATFVMTLLGAAVGFAVPGATRIANAHVALLGGGFGAFALAATLTGVRVGGFALIAVLLLAGAAAVAFYGAKAIAAADDGE